MVYCNSNSCKQKGFILILTLDDKSNSRADNVVVRLAYHVKCVQLTECCGHEPHHLSGSYEARLHNVNEIDLKSLSKLDLALQWQPKVTIVKFSFNLMCLTRLICATKVLLTSLFHYQEGKDKYLAQKTYNISTYKYILNVT